jgi:hypothetical protein
VRIRRLLIANRGEIAVRVIRTCRRLGIESVLAASDADLDSLPARLADRVVRLGPAPASASYLDPTAVVGAAQRVLADAVHPGYGFLSENPALARACEAAGIVFVGPTPASLEAVGDKLRARSHAVAAGLPVVPGGEAADLAGAQAVAAELLEAGVDPEQIYLEVYARAPEGRPRLFAEALQTLVVEPDVGLAWVTVPAGAIERLGVSSDDLDGVVEFPRSIEGVRMALLFREVSQGRVKVSLRSVGNVDVAAFAKRFGGGGHTKAAGLVLPGSLAEVQSAVLGAARAFLGGDGARYGGPGGGSN